MDKPFQYDPFQIADEVMARLSEQKIVCDLEAKSTNRHGERSAYLSIPVVGRVRISDHSANLQFRPDLKADFSHCTTDEIIFRVMTVIDKWKAEAPQREAKKLRIEAARHAEEERKQAIREAEARWVRLKDDFFDQHPELDAATETVRKKAWSDFKKSLRAEEEVQDEIRPGP